MIGKILTFYNQLTVLVDHIWGSRVLDGGDKAGERQENQCVEYVTVDECKLRIVVNSLKTWKCKIPVRSPETKNG